MILDGLPDYYNCIAYMNTIEYRSGGSRNFETGGE